MATLGLDQLALHVVLHRNGTSSPENDCHPASSTEEMTIETGSKSQHEGNERPKSSCEHSRTDLAVFTRSGSMNLTSACIIEASVFIHSIIIGFGLGSLGDEEMATIEVLIVVLCIHQVRKWMFP